MSAPSEYPPEKTGGSYPPPGPSDTHYYPPPPPADAAHHFPGAQAPSGAPSTLAQDTKTGGAPQEYYPPPPPADAAHHFPGAVPAQGDHTAGYVPQQQQNQAYNPTTWTPAQNQYDPSHHDATLDTGAGAVAAGSTTPDQGQGKLSAWDKARSGGKAGFDKLWAGFEKLGVPVNKFTNKIGSEAFWPQSLDRESDKCARILKSFCKDGFYSERPVDPAAPQDGPKSKPKVLVKIPQKVIKNAVALAIFTTMRTGLWISGAGGSGVLVSRLPDGSWSPPSGLLIHTAGVGFMAGIDIYDCVLVINTPEALAAFKKVRLSLGGELSLAAGPVGIGGVGEFDLFGEKNRKPIWTYMKSRGLYAGVQIDGSIVVERNDENARFYGERLPASDILSGKLRNVPSSTRLLMEVLKEAEGRTDVNQAILKEVDELPPPGDVQVEKGAEPTHDLKRQYSEEHSARYA